MRDALDAAGALIGFTKTKYRPQSIADLQEMARLEKDVSEAQQAYKDFVAERDAAQEARKAEAASRGETTISDLRANLRKGSALCETLLTRLEELNNEK